MPKLTVLYLSTRTAVLRKLGHIDAAGLVTLKGRAACEVTQRDVLPCAWRHLSCWPAHVWPTRAW